MNLEIIQSKLMNNITNKKKNEVGEDIIRAVNAVGLASRVPWRRSKTSGKTYTARPRETYLLSKEKQRGLAVGLQWNPDLLPAKK